MADVATRTPAPPADHPVQDRRPWVTAAAGSAVVVGLARSWTSRGRREYAIWPDEPAQLAIARFVGGGTRWNMHDHSTWRPGYGTLLSPVHWFTDDPVLVFRTALGLNAVLGGLAALLLVLLGRRLTSMGPWWCAAVAVVISLSPAVVFQTDFVWSESLVQLLFLASLLAVLHLHEVPTVHSGLVAGLLAAAAFAAHSRMLPLGMVVVGVVAVAAGRGRMTRAQAVLVVGVTAVATVAVSAYSGHVVDHLWNEPSTRNSFDGFTEQLSRPGAIVLSLSGQMWYLLVASLGIVVHGAFDLVRAGRGRGGDGTPARDDARLVLVIVAACAALSVVFMSDRWRPDQLVYGRYNDALVAPLLVVGVAALVGATPVRRLVAAAAVAVALTVVTAGVLWTFRRDLLGESNGLEPMILGLQPFIASVPSIDVARITATAVAMTITLTALAILARRLRAAALTLVVIAALAGVGYARTREVIDRDWYDRGDLSAARELGNGVLADGVPVDFLLADGSDATDRMMLLQMYLPASEFTVVHDAVVGATAPYVFAPVDDAALVRAGADVVWTDPDTTLGLWAR